MWKKALFALLVCVGFFVVAEFVLWACGVRPALHDDDFYVGFASQIPLFVEQEDADGHLRLVTAENKRRFFNDQQFPKEKAAGVVRVFCMGGSTTFGRPYDDATSFCGWLRKLLPAADGSHEWEVINAGGISYASYRVAALMEELADYEPDLFVIYCGHNEFLERRTYAGIIETPAAVRGLGALASRTRIYATMSRALDAVRGGQATSTEVAKLPGEVETILEKSVGPDQYARNEELQQQVIAHYRYNLARMIQIARGAGADVIFVTPASNLRDCSPFKSQHRSDLSESDRRQWQELFERAERDYLQGNFSHALTELDEAAKIDALHAGLHYQKLLRTDLDPEMAPYVVNAHFSYGSILAWQGNYDESVRHLRKALALKPDHAEAKKKLLSVLMDHGKQLVEAGRPQEAVKRFEEVLAAQADNADAHSHLGVARMQLGRIPEAISQFEIAIQLDPRHLFAHNNLGVALVNSGRLAEAEEQFRRAVEIDSNYRPAQRNLQLLLERQRASQPVGSASSGSGANN